MNLSLQIAKHFREVYFGGNWTCSDLRATVQGVDWRQATRKQGSLNSIAALVYHIGYFVTAILQVMQGEQLTTKDIYSFDHPAIENEEDWQMLLKDTFSNVEHAATLIEQLPEQRWWEVFGDEKYGNYYRNVHGVIEHTHYHLGQIAVVKKMIHEGAHR